MSSRTEERTLTLRVVEALPKDAGRGIVRLDPQDLTALGLSVGGTVELLGKRNAPARALPAYVDDRGKAAIQMDGILRENTQTGLGERIALRGANASPARSVVLAPLSSFSSPHEKDGKYLGRLLEGLPLRAGDRVRAALFGSKFCEFLCKETTPQGIVQIHPQTQISVRRDEGSERQSCKLSYEDIGGLEREIQRIREMIELPLRYPEIFERLGIEAPKGVLLHGPPGCGKTLIARAVAHETEASFFSVSGPEVIHKFYGESEAKLRNLFEEARKKAPSIIFLDEIDAIAPKRTEVQGEVEKRVVAQLLALLDGLESRKQVIVIGATNIPNSLDPALRRPGRFDREMTIPIPDRKGREAILQIHTRGMPLAPDVNLTELAEKTHGFVGADLEALCREAAMAALRSLLPFIDFQTSSIPYEQLLEISVTRDHFLQAFREVEPSALREILVEVPEVRWNDVAGLLEAKAALQESVEWPLSRKELFTEAGITAPRGILLTGPPGTGKTLLAKACATECGVNFVSIKGPALLSKWVGESEKGVREIFRKAKQAAPCILFFDEIDALLPKRGTGADTPVTERVLSQFLTEMDGIEDLKDVVVLGATNRPDLLDGALTRPGRFETVVEIPLPNDSERLEILEIHTRKMPLSGDVNLSGLADTLAGTSGADLSGICRKAALLAIRETMESGEPRVLTVTNAHFLEAAGRKGR
ncbi:MAG: CDC48 family AAA ATPase [Armatimonadetes bacterium]|nr:CDC48 family AAA ATPase [Armatimonadota bacterium]